MTSKINHEVRNRLFLSVLEYCAADIIQQTGKDTPTVNTVVDYIGMSELEVWPILERLKKAELITISPKAGNLKVTVKWREAVKPEPKERKGDPLNHELKLVIESKIKGYWWRAADYQHADEILAQLRFKFKTKTGFAGSDEQIMTSLNLVLDNLPEFWKGKWDTAKLNANLNSIIEQIKYKSHGKIVDSAISIKAASKDFIPNMNFD